MTEFTERYKSLSNFELWEILAEAENYQPLAVETAKKEIESRNLSEEEINRVKLEIESKQLEKQKLIENRKQKEDKIKGVVFTFLDAINPIQNGIQTPEKTIRLIVIALTGIFFYRIFKQFNLLRFILTDSEGGWDMSMLEYFFPLIILPLATIYFWKRKKIGWILLSIFLTYSAISSIGLFFMSLGQQPLGNPALDVIFPIVSPIIYLFGLFVYVGTLWTISKEGIREIYQIDKKAMWRTIGIFAIIYFLALGFLMLG